MSRTNRRHTFANWLQVCVLVCAGFWVSGVVQAGEREDVLWLNRLSFGATPQSLLELQKMGRGSWLTRQLRADTADPLPPAVQERINALRITQQTGLQLLTHQAELPRGDSKEARVATAKQIRAESAALRHETVERALLQAVYSPNQLRELLTWFWFNHFNVAAHGPVTIMALVGDYEQYAIRRHATGRFRDLLEAVVTHPAMLVYLNNNRNVRGRINENYARELMELHTLGVDGGYTQQDVQQLAKILTGLGTSQPGQEPAPEAVRFSQGMAEFVPKRHEPGGKVLLGQKIDREGWAQIQQALDVLARHPATARYISLKLARYFVADEPPPELISRLSKRFLESEGDISAVMQTLVMSPEFEASLGKKFKDPVQYVISAIRLVSPGEPADLRAHRIQGWLRLLEQPLYGRQTPDGYPMTAAAWNGSGQMTQRFDVALQIAQAHHGETPPKLLSRLLGSQDAWSQNVLLPGLSGRSRETLQEAQNQPVTWRQLLLSTPEFMFR